jgi:hypothetical protein
MAIGRACEAHEAYVMQHCMLPQAVSDLQSLKEVGHISVTQQPRVHQVLRHQGTVGLLQERGGRQDITLWVDRTRSKLLQLYRCSLHTNRLQVLHNAHHRPVEA